jgi:gliding motility-associated lipoprotein GldH
MNKRKDNMKNLLLVVLAVLLFSCNKNKVFEQSIKFDNYDWKLGQTLKFEVAIEDTASYYNVIVEVRHTDNYPYDGLLINMSYNAPNGEMHTKNHKLNFRNDAGGFIGEGSGDIWDESVAVMEKVKFNSVGIYKFEITSNMPKTPVQGIMELGLSIEKN